MRILVTYDIADERRLRRVAKVSEDFGVRVQKSVFECELEEDRLQRMKRALAAEMNPTFDSVRFYRLCKACRAATEVMGCGTVRSDDKVIVL